MPEFIFRHFCLYMQLQGGGGRLFLLIIYIRYFYRRNNGFKRFIVLKRIVA